MARRLGIVIVVGVALAGGLNAPGVIFGQAQAPDEKTGPMPSLPPVSEFEVGIGNISKDTCIVSALTQPAVYAGNSLLDCDAETPHNETTIAVNPRNSNHIVGGYHSYRLSQVGNTVVARITSAASVSFDGGSTWQETFPPSTPYQSTGDPAVAFDADGRVYFASIAFHESAGGWGPHDTPRLRTSASIVVTHSDDGGVTWSQLVTVASGKGGAGTVSGPQIFQDKVYIATDSGLTSPHRNRVYVTWTSFVSIFAGQTVFFRDPILSSFSDNGTTWSAPREISGSSPFCNFHFFGPSIECDLNQSSSPSVAPNGRAYVGFENFNILGPNQYMVVSSTDSGATWSLPSRVDRVHDVNLPLSVNFQETLTGCQLRLSAPGNIAADPSDATGMRVYATWADNRNGSGAATNMDVFVYRSTDGGSTWSLFQQINDVNDQFFPWLAVAPNGRVDVGYMDRRYSSGQTVCQYGFTLTRINGTTGAIISKTRVDTGLSDPGHDAWFSPFTDGNSVFIGDYTGVAVAPDGATYSLWTDLRNIVSNPPSPTRNHGQHAVAAKTAP